MPKRGQADDATMLQRQVLWRECCQSSDVHRFDCREAPRERRGGGPFGPARAPTAAEIVAALRASAAGAQELSDKLRRAGWR